MGSDATTSRLPTYSAYALVGKYMWVDLENLYFAPLAALREQ